MTHTSTLEAVSKRWLPFCGCFNTACLYRLDHHQYLCSLPALPQQEASHIIGLAKDWSNRDGSDLYPYTAILVARSPHWTSMTGPCAIDNRVVTVVLKLSPAQQEILTPATICRLCMLQNVRTTHLVTIVYSAAEICHTCKAAAWPQQFPALEDLDVLCLFWLQHLNMQELMVLSLIGRLHTKITETELHLLVSAHFARPKPADAHPS